ncbi:hypothetical protein O6H91_22G030400 [Diphasiastrum complanatum]|uniref:Uncharacterized protein n=1 Tax=Diphasiastrum complanatum TaxID=34168 RepID=A0ACC2AFE1_DIPCM|nr:hypothetical protein O6H91_22G030400 [Diphasiastrum complanatum]
MGVISRRVLPVCGNLCICCPGLRSRSRQPVKRYKQLLANIFPKSQDEAPNDRKISKLCEYASKNPMRIPKIAQSLEQRGYKELRNEHFGSVRVVMRAYCKLISSCREQMPLFAISTLDLITTLLEQMRQDEMRKLACTTLVEFIYNQTDATYMRNLICLLPKLCELARETGEQRRRCSLRAAGLQALSAMAWFLGEHSQLVPEFDEIVAVTLDNYVVPSEANGHEGWGQHNWMKEVFKGDGFAAMSAMKDAIVKLSFHKESSHLKDSANLSKVDAETPEVWAHICIQHIARLAKEATTARRVLEPMFLKFDMEKKWLTENGLALAVLRDMQFRMEKTGNDHLLLAVLVRHLDHKNIVNQPQLKTSIVTITANLARQSNPKANVLEVGAVSDLIRHLQKSFQSFSETASPPEMETPNWNSSLQTAIEECLTEFAKRIGDASPILEMMAVVLEKLSTNVLIARSTIESMSVLAFILFSLPEVSSYQGFPEALFHQLVRAMVHPDIDTRIGAHSIFATLIIPPSIFSKSDFFLVQSEYSQSGHSSRISLALASTAVLFEKLWNTKSGYFREVELESVPEGRNRDNEDPVLERNTYTEKVECGTDLEEVKQNSGSASPSWLQVLNTSIGRTLSQGRRTSSSSKEIEMTAVRLSGHQVALLFSRLWVQASIPDNVPGNFEAMAHTYGLTLMFSRAKTSSHSTLVHAFQLAFSLRTCALDQNSILAPSRRRSLHVLAISMLVLAAKVYNIPEIVPLVKATLNSETVSLKDPFLELLDDGRLVLSKSSQVNFRDYGTADDDRVAMTSLSSISLTSENSNEAIVSLIVNSKLALLEAEGPDIADELLQTFVPDNTFILGSHFSLDMTTFNPLVSRDSMSFDEILAAGVALQDDLVSEESAAEVPQLIAKAPVPASLPHVMGVTQLLESALETAGQLAILPVPPASLSFSAVASHCEAFDTDSRKKMLMIMNLNANIVPLQLTLPGNENELTKSFSKNMKQRSDDSNSNGSQQCAENGGKWTRTVSMKNKDSGQSPIFSPPWLTAVPQEPWEAFRLPPASPYDTFLKAAGC